MCMYARCCSFGAMSHLALFQMFIGIASVAYICGGVVNRW